MSEQKDTTLSELEEATMVSDLTSEDVSTQVPSDPSDSSAEDTVINQMVEKKTTNIDYAKQQEDVWAERIASDTTGEVLKKFKENKALKWLHDRVDVRLGIAEKPKMTHVGDFSAQMAEYEANKEKASLLEKFKSLPIDQRKEINNKVREAVKELGADPSKVLAKFLSEAKQPASSSVINVGVRTPGTKTITIEQLSKLPQKEYELTVARIKNGEITQV
jgi:hypothetical protein